MKRSTGLILLCAALSACSFYARGPDDYLTAVRGLLEQKKPDVEACYKRTYDADQSAQGHVVVTFEVEPKTGKIVKPAVAQEGTTANPALQQCALAALDGLALDPPDQRTGVAKYTWDFSR
jgi:hypothetical protein